MKKDNAIQTIKGQYENVATALYLVTNHLKDTEPFKNRVRQISHDILEQMIHMSDISYVHVEAHTEHLLSLLKIASASGLIAPQNANILQVALKRTLKDIQDYMKSMTNMAISLSDLLYIESDSDTQNNDWQDDAQLEANQNSGKQDFPVRNAIDSGNISNVSNKANMPMQIRPMGQQVNQRPQTAQNNSSQMPALSQKMSFNGVAEMRKTFGNMAQAVGRQDTSVSDMYAKGNQGQYQNSDSNNSQNAQSGPRVLSDRQNIIIREIRNKGNLTIRDLADKIKGCSEKTIQRELLALVNSGVLKKEGERRWSKYSINPVN